MNTSKANIAILSILAAGFAGVRGGVDMASDNPRPRRTKGEAVRMLPDENRTPAGPASRRQRLQAKRKWRAAAVFSDCDEEAAQ